MINSYLRRFIQLTKIQLLAISVRYFAIFSHNRDNFSRISASIQHENVCSQKPLEQVFSSRDHFHDSGGLLQSFLYDAGRKASTTDHISPRVFVLDCQILCDVYEVLLPGADHNNQLAQHLSDTRSTLSLHAGRLRQPFV